VTGELLLYPVLAVGLDGPSYRSTDRAGVGARAGSGNAQIHVSLFVTGKLALAT
jgi:hypothetical protein